MRTTTRIALTAALAALPLAAQHEKDGEKSRNPAIGDPKAIEAGRALFANGCAACHGSEGQGGRGPNLRERVFWHPLEDDTLFAAIKKGVGGGMPAANLPDDQTWQVVAFVRSMTSPAIENPPAGDVTAGESLFWGKAGCSNCHAIGGKGSAFGPALTNVAAMRPALDIRQSILDPDADGAPGYRGVTVVMNDGSTLKGVARNRTNYSLQLQDAKGNLHLLSVASIREIATTKGSPMPKDFGTRLTKTEIDNLVAFLSRQSVHPAPTPKK